MSKEQEFFECPNCGAQVRVGAHSCPECGSDDSTGWKKDAEYEHIDLPEGYSNDKEFDYDEYVHREFGWGGPKPLSKPPIPAKQLILPFIALLLIAVLIWRFL